MLRADIAAALRPIVARRGCPRQFFLPKCAPLLQPFLGRREWTVLPARQQTAWQRRPPEQIFVLLRVDNWSRHSPKHRPKHCHGHHACQRQCLRHRLCRRKRQPWRTFFFLSCQPYFLRDCLRLVNITAANKKKTVRWTKLGFLFEEVPQQLRQWIAWHEIQQR